MLPLGTHSPFVRALSLVFGGMWLLLSGSIVFVVSPLRLCFGKTGWSLRRWRPHLGGWIQFLLTFSYVMFNMLWKAYDPLGPLWLRVPSFLRGFWFYVLLVRMFRFSASWGFFFFVVSCVPGFPCLHHGHGLSQASGSQVPFVTGSPLGSKQCRLGFGSALSPVFFFSFLRSSHVFPSVLWSGCQLLLTGVLYLLFFPFVWKSLVFGGAFWLVRISGLPSRRGRPLGWVSVSLSPLIQSNLRISLAMGSSFGPCSGLVAIRSPFFFLGLFLLCPSAVALALSPLWICVS